MPNFFDKKICDSLWKLETLLEARIKTKKNTSRIRIQSILVAKTIFWTQQAKKNRSRKDGGKERKALHKLMINAKMGIQTKLYATQNI